MKNQTTQTTSIGKRMQQFLSSISIFTSRALMVVIFGCLTLVNLTALAQTQTQTFTTVGGYITWIPPAGVTSVQLECWGAGGGGGGCSNNNYSGGGGGGGGYAKKVNVSIGTDGLYVQVGGGGAGGAGSTSGANGGATSVSSAYSTTTYTFAAGGIGGYGGSVANGAGGNGAGGTGNLNIGDAGSTYTGGNGAAGVFGTTGGGGGGGAGSSHAGGNGGSPSAHSAGAGGATGGGNGSVGTIGTNAVASSLYGGGGGGTCKISGTAVSGGNGANGKAALSWVCPTYSLTATSLIGACSNNAAVNLTGALPNGTYTITYNLSGANASIGNTVEVVIQFNKNSCNFQTVSLPNPGSVTITITNIASSTCSNAITTNNTATAIINTPPAIPAVMGTISTSFTTATLNWTRGSGTGGVIVVAKINGTPQVEPLNGNPYIANAVYGTYGSDIATAAFNYVVYNGTGTSAVVSGLTPGYPYVFTVYEYNAGTLCYSTPDSSGTVFTLNPGWSGATSTDWNTASNWSSGTVPTSSTGVIIFPAANQPVINAAVTCNSITLMSGTSLTINDTLNVNTFWTNNGGTVSGTGTVNFQGTGTIEGTASTVFPNLTISGSGTITMGIATTVNGDFTMQSGTFIQNTYSNFTANPTEFGLTIGGNFNVFGGTYDFFSGTGGQSIITLNGNFNQTTGTITTSGTAPNGLVIFNKTGTQTYFASNPQWIQYTIASTSTLQLLGNLYAFGNNTFLTSVTVNGILDAGLYKVINNWNNLAGTFTLAANATLKTKNTSGLATTIDGTTFATRTFDAGANYVFNGTSAQVTSILLPTAFTSGGSLTVSNSAGVTLSQATAFGTGSTLYLTSGAFTNAALLAMNNGSSINRAMGILVSVPTFAPTVNVTYSGTTAVNTANELPTGSANLGNLTVGKTGGVTLIASATVNGNVVINSGCSLKGGAFSHAITGNWLNNGTYTANSSTVTFNGTSQQTIGGTSATTFNNLSIANTAGVLLGNSEIVNGILALSGGNLDISSFNLTIGASGVITNAAPSNTSMIIADGGGAVRKTTTAVGSFTFPIGDGATSDNGAEYSPITVDITAGTFSSAYIGVGVTDGKHPNNSSTTTFLTRYWNVSQAGITGCTSNITASFLNSINDVNGSLGDIKGAQLKGLFNQTTNPWLKTGGSILLGTMLTYNSATLTAATPSVFTGITSADPTVSITGGNSSVCQNSIAVLTANPIGDGPFKYSWTGAITGSTTSSTATATTSTLGGSNNYTVVVKDANGIVSAASTAVTITVNNVITIATVSSPTTLCSGGTLNPTTPTVTANAVSSQGWQMETAAGSGTFASLIVPYTVAFADNGKKIRYTATNGCGTINSNQVTITVNTSSTSTIIASGPTTFCSGGSVSLTAGSSALQFNGSNASATINDFAIGMSDFTIEAWINPANTSSYIITSRTNENGAAGNWFEIAVGSTNKLKLELAANNSSYSILEGNTNIPLNTWSHIAVVRNGTTISFYINGVADASFADPIIRNLTTGNNFHFGGWPDYNQYWYNGSLQEVRHWNTARTQSEIQANMSTTVAPTSSGLARYYRLDEGTGSTITDLLNSVNNGTLTGTNWQNSYSPVANYTSFLWSDNSTLQSVNNISANGTYAVAVTNSNGCTSTSTATVVTVNLLPTPTINGNLSFCSGSSTVLDAGSGYTSYSWSNGATTQTISANTAATFTVTVTNVNGCTGLANVITTVNANLTPSISGSLSFCSGSSTSLDGGSGYTSYNWSNGATTQTISANTAATYTVTVTNTIGCTASVSAIVNLETIPPTFAACPVAPIDLGCNPATLPDAAAAVTAAGAVSDNCSVASVVAVSDGITGFCNKTETFTVTAADNAGNTGECSITYIWKSDTQIPVITATKISSNIGCNPTNAERLAAFGSATALDNCDGDITGAMTVSTSAPVNISGCNWEQTRTWNVTDACGNAATPVLVTVSYIISTPITATATITNVLCKGNKTGAISVIVSGGCNVTYLWSNGATTASITNVFARNIKLTVTDQCQTKVFKYTITEPATGIILTGVTKKPKCTSGATGTATVVGSGGVSPYAYLWSNGQTNSIATGLAAGTYIVTVTDAPGCTRAMTFVVIGPAAMSVSLAATHPTTQLPTSGQIIATVAGGTPNYVYLWNTSPYKTTATITGLTSGTYIVKVTDKNACTTTASVALVNTPTRIVNATYDPSIAVSVMPNPSDGLFTVKVVTATQATALLELLDLTSRVVLTENMSLIAGNNALLLDAQALPKGIYLLRLNVNDKIQTIRLIIQ